MFLIRYGINNLDLDDPRLLIFEKLKVTFLKKLDITQNAENPVDIKEIIRMNNGMELLIGQNTRSAHQDTMLLGRILTVLGSHWSILKNTDETTESRRESARLLKGYLRRHLDSLSTIFKESRDDVSKLLTVYSKLLMYNPTQALPQDSKIETWIQDKHQYMMNYYLSVVEKLPTSAMASSVLDEVEYLLESALFSGDLDNAYIQKVDSLRNGIQSDILENGLIPH